MQHLDLKLLRSFAAVAQECSVTRAAERLNITQPTVSGQIKELEQILGFVLFHRTSRKVTLSDQGERLLPRVEALLALAEDVRHEAEAMQQYARTRFRLGAAMYTMDFEDRIALLDAFAKRHPALSYTIDNRLQSDQVRDLLGEQLDASLLLGIAADIPAVKFVSEHPPGVIVNEVQYPASLERVVLRRRRIGLMVPEGSDLAGHEVIPREALAGQRIAMLSREHGDRVTDPLVAFIEGSGAQPVWHREGNALAIERQALRDGTCAIGIGWFPVLPGMALRAAEGLDLHFEFALVLGTSPNAAARKLFDFARDWQSTRSVPLTALAAA